MNNRFTTALAIAIACFSLLISTHDQSIAAEQPQVPKGINDGSRRGLTGTESPLVQHNFLVVGRSTSPAQRVQSEQ